MFVCFLTILLTLYLLIVWRATVAKDLKQTVYSLSLSFSLSECFTLCMMFAKTNSAEISLILFLNSMRSRVSEIQRCKQLKFTFELFFFVFLLLLLCFILLSNYTLMFQSVTRKRIKIAKQTKKWERQEKRLARCG